METLLTVEEAKQIYIPSEGGVYWKIRLFNSIKRTSRF